MSNLQHWYYINKNYEEDGPVSSEEIKDMAKRGDIHKGTYVWTQELPEWVPASKVAGLFDDRGSSKSKAKPMAPPKPLHKKTSNFPIHESSSKKPTSKTSLTMKPLERNGGSANGKNNIPKPVASPGQGVFPISSAVPRVPIQGTPQPHASIPQPQVIPQAGIPQPHAAIPQPQVIPQAGIPQAGIPVATPVPQPIPQQPSGGAPIPPPGTAAGANSIPAPQLHTPGAVGKQPPAPIPPGVAAGLPTIPPAGAGAKNLPPQQSVEPSSSGPIKKPRPMTLD